MNDQPVQDPQQTTTSYVDDYTPPTPSEESNLADVPLDESPLGGDVSATDSNNPSMSSDQQPIAEKPEETHAADEVLSDEDFEGVAAGSADSDEDLEAQNIFFMLGVNDGEEALKEKFLDQLQDVIWDDFLANDVQLLLTEDEMTQFKTRKEKVDSAQGEAQEQAKDEIVEFLETLIPDLEDIMLEKALDLKADLFVERINGMKEYFVEKPDQLALVNKAEQLMGEDKWKSAADTLNSIKE